MKRRTFFLGAITLTAAGGATALMHEVSKLDREYELPPFSPRTEAQALASIYQDSDKDTGPK